jgi:hypothetical protein
MVVACCRARIAYDEPVPTVRLERETPAARQAGRATAIGAGLGALGAAMIYVLRYHVSPASTDWLVYVVGGGFLLTGLVMLVLGVRMLAAARLPETIVEVESVPVAAGTSVRVTLRQPGPLSLQSLRLNLVAEQVTTRFVWRRGRRERDRDRRLVHQQNVIDVTEVVVAGGEEFATQAVLTMPSHVTLADVEGDKTVVWRLEVWGRVRAGIDFGHPFILDVRGMQKRTS